VVLVSQRPRRESDVRRYFMRKLAIYGLTFFVAVTIDWLIPRFMPGDPVAAMLSRAQLRPEALGAMTAYYTKLFGLDVPVWQQYLNFWSSLFHGDPVGASGCSPSP
jgi:peptide/nickel transport system permease protein